jgi:hypothetical protein
VSVVYETVNLPAVISLWVLFRYVLNNETDLSEFIYNPVSVEHITALYDS